MKIINPEITGMINCNRHFSKWITKGIQVNFMDKDEERGRQLKLIDFNNIEKPDKLRELHSTIVEAVK